jgi:molybdenum cofactor biosynthesis enzyme
MARLTHFDKKGRARMVDVSKKTETLRRLWFGIHLHESKYLQENHVRGN